MKDLVFRHIFYDGREMSIRVKRNGGLPELVCKPKFCGAEDAMTLHEYAIWRGEIFASLTEILEETEMLAIVALGANLGTT